VIRPAPRAGASLCAPNAYGKTWSQIEISITYALAAFILGDPPYSIDLSAFILTLHLKASSWGWLAGAGSPCRKRVALARGGARHIAAFIMAMRKMVRIELRVDGHARWRGAAHLSISFSQGSAATEPGIPRVLRHRGQEVL